MSWMSTGFRAAAWSLRRRWEGGRLLAEGGVMIVRDRLE